MRFYKIHSFVSAIVSNHVKFVQINLYAVNNLLD